jgi:sulfite exporter TauE/SafE
VIDYGLIFLTGALTSLHCVGMCGAIVLAYATTPTLYDGAVALHRNPLGLHAAYNGGRILSYALLGALAGLVGMSLSAFAQVASAVAVASGLVMIVAGISMLGLLPFRTTVSLGGGGSWIGRLHGKLLRGKGPGATFSLGFLTPVLPCGLVYAMLARAAAAGTVTDGALTMAVFGAGMAPSLMLLGSVSTFFTARTRRQAERVASAAILLMGVVLVLRGFGVGFLEFLPIGTTGVMDPACCPK